jgi:pimeloyl-ACP methyl ester carboxylesterase
MKKAIWYVLMGLIIVLSSCEKDKVEYGPEEIMQFGTESARVQELSFPSGDFTIVGDLRMPLEGGPHPVILMIHGSGGATRNGAVPFTPMIEIFLRNGYAVLSWDKPGSGESKGSFDPERTIFQRADILTDAIEVLAENSSIDLSVVGLWGLSQAGWVMPLALENSNRISFMIVVSGGGEDGIEQGAYQVAQRIACLGGSPEDVQTLEQYWAIMNKAEDYLTYREAAEIVLEIPGVYEETGFVINEEEDWNPWPRDIGAFFDPRDVLRETTIPVLAFFGELDKYVDPVQGAQAYETSLAAAGNLDYLVVSNEGAGHVMVAQETGCPGEYVGNVYMSEYLETLESWLMDR